MTENLRVHLSAVGFDTPNRVVEPLVSKRADKVYLVTHLKNNAEAAENLEKVRKAIGKRIPNLTVNTVVTDVWDLFSCLGEYRKIFAEESSNHLYVNVSTGSKVVVIAGMLSCMLWGGNAYYVRLDYSGTDQEKVIGIDDLPVYKINRPNEELLKVLSVVSKNRGKIYKRDLIKILQEDRHRLIPIYTKDQSPTAPHSRLKTYLEPLQHDWKFLEVRTRGRRSEIHLTEQGVRALRIFGDWDPRT